MRILVIGDIHGHNGWEKVVSKEDWDKVVFLGDYFDNYKNTPGKEQVTNFKKILAMKATHPDKVELLYPIDGYRQIVGHTQMNVPVNRDKVWFNDMMPKYYIIVEDGNIEFKENKLEV